VATGSPAELKRRIGGNVIEVHVRDEDDLPRVAELLAPLGDEAAQIDEPTRRVSLQVERGSSGLTNALRALEDARVEVEDIALRQPNLDEVFLALTGQPADDDAQIAADAA
jgi:ABC-2 type transport system ATP-binding protein